MKPLRLSTKGHPLQVLADKWKKGVGWLDTSYRDALSHFKGKRAVVTIKADGELIAIWWGKKPIKVLGVTTNCIMANHYASIYVNNPVAQYFSRLCEKSGLSEVIAFGELFTQGQDGEQLPFPHTLSVIKTGSWADWVKEVRFWLFELDSVNGKKAPQSYIKRLKILRLLVGKEKGEGVSVRENSAFGGERDTGTDGEDTEFSGEPPIVIRDKTSPKKVRAAVLRHFARSERQRQRLYRWIFDPTRTKIAVFQRGAKGLLEDVRRQVRRLNRDLLASGGPEEGHRLALDYPADVYLRRIYVVKKSVRKAKGRRRSKMLEDMEVPVPPKRVLRLYEQTSFKIIKIPYRPPPEGGIKDPDRKQDKLLRRHMRWWVTGKRIPFPQWFAERLKNALASERKSYREKHRTKNLGLCKVAVNEFIVCRPTEGVK